MSLHTFASSFFLAPSKQKPSDWCQERVTIPPPQTEREGLFRLSGQEYCREFIDDFGDPEITDEAACFGSQTGKTNSLMMGVAWCIANDPSALLWVMPNVELARSFSRNRWVPIVDNTPDLAALKPTGARRHDFKTSEQQIGASILNFIGSNSPANLSSRPVRRLILDEVDKFDEGGRGEADAVNLAEQRTKSFSRPQRFKVSTPTMLQGLIWQEFLKGDQRRFFVPCPHCYGFVLLIWSKAFCSLKHLGCEAPVRWDKEAKRENGTWDLERVEKSARAECPHCGGHIRDGHKTRIVRDGEWRATATAPKHFRSRHLPSLYASMPETGFGALAVKFLQAKESLLGLQGFINGDLAEPYQSQDTMGERIELVTERIEITAEWKKVLTADCQQKAPYFWHLVRAWSANESKAIEAGNCSTWNELREIQIKHAIPDVCVFVDSGFGAKSDAEVYKNCVRFCEVLPREVGLALALGWMPCKGMPTSKRWKDTDSGLMLPYFLRPIDPFVGTAKAGSVEMSLFEFSADFFKDILQNLRAGKGGQKWSVEQSVSTDEYWQHMDAEIKQGVFSKMTGRTTHVWKKRAEHWPNHLLDCEVLQVAAATFLGMLALEEPEKKEKAA